MSKLHKCSFCESDGEPTIAIRRDVWDMTARIFCSCGAKVTVTIPLNTNITKDVDTTILRNHVRDTAITAWNSMNH